MTTATFDPITVPTTEPARADTRPALGALTLAGSASLAAGTIHAAAVAAHAEHSEAVAAFAVLTVAQIAWAALAFALPARRVAVAGVAVAAAALAGWIAAKTTGIPFVEGLDEVENAQLSDSLAATLACISGGLALLSVVSPLRPTRSVLVGGAAIVLGLSGLPGVVTAADHQHAGDADGHGHADVASPAADTHTPAVVPPKPYDPTKPIDLGGVDGVTPEEQARAENLISVTLLRLPRFADPAAAEAAGFRSIGDALTGYEHFVHWGWIDDDKILDPDYPESIVYRVVNGQRTLEAAMYMLPRGRTLEDVPREIGGKLVQWHIHNNLCYTPDPAAPKVAGLTLPDGTCRPPLVEGPRVPMVHVWIVPHKCGPFAALEGVGAGQISDGETRLCDHAHGASA
jgi:hypothetical protein